MAVVIPSPQRLPYYQRRRLRRDKIPFVNNTFIAPSVESLPGAHRPTSEKRVEWDISISDHFYECFMNSYLFWFQALFTTMAFGCLVDAFLFFFLFFPGRWFQRVVIFTANPMTAATMRPGVCFYFCTKFCPRVGSLHTPSRAPCTLAALG